MRRRKHSIILITAIIILVISAISCLAHSGRTDGRGGHYDRSSGEYHFHHGYSAHQHPNGVCPYDDEDDYTTESYSTKEELKYTAVIFKILGKLSIDHEWHMSDVIHLIIVILLPILIFIWASDDMVWRTRRYGDLAFVLFISVILSGYSLSVIFPYDIKGFEFLCEWVGVGILIPLILLIMSIVPLSFIYLLLSGLNFDNKNDKDENK